MTFINYYFNFTTWTVWTAGLLVKDAITLIFNDNKTGELITVEGVINYSARGYGRMVIQLHKRLDNRMFEKHQKYMKRVDAYRLDVVKPALDELKGKEFKTINKFIKTYNG